MTIDGYPEYPKELPCNKGCGRMAMVRDADDPPCCTQCIKEMIGKIAEGLGVKPPKGALDSGEM